MPMKLSELATFIKSANAGATQLTFDIGFADEATFRRVVESGAIDANKVAALYGVARDRVRIYAYTPACAIKITIPRPSLSGGLDERDFDGVQQFAPLLDIEVDVDSRGRADGSTRSVVAA